MDAISKINLQVGLIKEVFYSIVRSLFNDNNDKSYAYKEEVGRSLRYFTGYKLLQDRLNKLEVVSYKLNEYNFGSEYNE